MRIYYEPNGTSQTFHPGDTARANIQDKIKNLRQQSWHIRIRQFKVHVRREAYQDPTNQALYQYNEIEVCVGEANTSELLIAL